MARGGVWPRLFTPAWAVALLLGALWSPALPSGSGQWPAVPPVASYRIQVRLDPVAHTLDAHETITYTNRTADTIDRLVFHLYLNAFRDTETLFLRETLGSHRGYGFDPGSPGSVEVERLIWEGEDLLPRTLVRETLMTTTLPVPLEPGDTLSLEVDFRAQLPRVFARTGFADTFHMVGQWFPKLGVYEPGRGWNAHPFHANSEFYADFGNYDVFVTVPEAYRVGATGVEIGHTTNDDGTVTYHFHAEAVIDFAWTAWPDFREARKQVDATEVVLLYAPNHAAYVERYLEVAERALRTYGAWFGPYPYPRLTIVDVPEMAGGAGGMEYPMLVTAGPPTPFPASLLGNSFPEMVTAHEIAHQWWQSTVATNEAEEPWLDEGFAEYSSVRFMDLYYPPSSRPAFLGDTYLEGTRFQYWLNPSLPADGKAWDYGMTDYAIAVYSKPAVILATMERLTGAERWLAVMHTYYQRYRFAHPRTEDFLGVVREVAGNDAAEWLEGLLRSQEAFDVEVTGLRCSRRAPYACEVDLARRGGVALPVEVQVTFADGRQVWERWEGGQDTVQYRYTGDAPVLWVQADPAAKLCVDTLPYNNSYTLRPQWVALARISRSWLLTVEQWLSFLGGLW